MDSASLLDTYGYLGIHPKKTRFHLANNERLRRLSKMRVLLLSCLAILAIFPAPFWQLAPISVHASQQQPNYRDDSVANVTGTPMDIAWTPDGRMLILMRSGKLLIRANGVMLPTPAIDLSQVTCTSGDEGMGGVAVHPNFTQNNYIYLYYTYQKSGTCTTGSANAPVNRLSRFTLSSNNSINPASGVVLLDSPPLPTFDHMGDDLQFGPDNNLYLAIGDGGSPCCTSTFNYPEDPGVLLGKIVRLTDSGGIPLDNPFTGSNSARCNLTGVPPAGSPSGTRCQEVYAMGLRNPFKASFDPSGSRYFINDVGNATWEEVDLGQPGADYGWPTREGPCSAANPVTDCGPPTPGLTNPIFWYGHNVTADGVKCGAITAGAFVPNGLWPGFDHSYLYADWNCGGIWQLDSNNSGGFTSTFFAKVGAAGPISMRFGPYGNSLTLYYVFGNYGSKGQLRRISLSSSLVSLVEGTDGAVYWNKYTSGSWNTWQYLSGSTSTTPSLCSASPTRTELVLRGTDNGVYHKSFINGVWSTGWDSLGGGTFDQPACVVANGVLHVVVRGTDNGTWYNSMQLSTGGWSGWSVVSGGSTLSAPSLTVDASGTVQLVVRGTDNGVWHSSKPSGGSWTGWDSPGGSTPDTPAIVSDSNFLYAVVRGSDDGIWYNTMMLSSGAWSGWSWVGGSTSASPSLTQDSSRALHLVVRGTDNGIWHNMRNMSGSWSGWDTPGGATLNQPAAMVQGSTLFVIVRGTDNAVWTNTWSLATRSWSNWSSLGGTTSAMPSIATSA